MSRNRLPIEERENENKIYMAIVGHWKDNFCSPTVRELAAVTQIIHPSIVYYHIRRLVEDGMIVRTPGKARSFIPVGLEISYKPVPPEQREHALLALELKLGLDHAEKVS